MILDISEDPIARAYGGNAIGTDPNPKSIDPKETAAYYPEKGGGILEIDADVMFTNPADPGQPRVVDESQEFLLTGTANAGIAKAERRGQLQPTDFLRALGRTGASLVVESVSIAPLDNSTQSLVFSGASITLHGITDGGTAVTPADAGTLLPTFYGNTVAQAQLQQQDYNTAEQERLSEPVMVV